MESSLPIELINGKSRFHQVGQTPKTCLLHFDDISLSVQLVFIQSDELKVYKVKSVWGQWIKMSLNRFINRRAFQAFDMIILSHLQENSMNFNHIYLIISKLYNQSPT